VPSPISTIRRWPGWRADVDTHDMLHMGSSGAAVFVLQDRLIQLGLYRGMRDGQFGPLTEAAVYEFQRQHGLKPDGIVGPLTEVVLWPHVVPVTPDDTGEIVKPLRCLTGIERQQIFGRFEYRVLAGGEIQILGDWESRNLVSAEVPELSGVPWFSVHGDPCSGRIRLHRLAAPQFQAWFRELSAAGLRDRILTIDGAFCARMVRGSTTSVSNHAFGTALDINAEWNGLGHAPAPRGRYGSVIDLVDLARQHGIAWGGHWSRPDGMHFEVAQLIQEAPA
jgi:peptidoglycan hydrolase-like protein with peptidoglycan-binding domain